MINDVGRENVCGVRVRVAQVVGETDGGEGVVVAVCRRVEFNHSRGSALRRQSISGAYLRI